MRKKRGNAGITFFSYSYELETRTRENEQVKEEHEGTQVQLGLGLLEEVLCTEFYRAEEPHGRPTIVVGRGPLGPIFFEFWLST